MVVIRVLCRLVVCSLCMVGWVMLCRWVIRVVLFRVCSLGWWFFSSLCKCVILCVVGGVRCWCMWLIRFSV